MVFAFFREKFNGGKEFLRIFGFDGVHEAVVGKFGVEKIGFASDFDGRMGVGVRDKGNVVEGGKAPVHRGI